jgi:hypothetical protein
MPIRKPSNPNLVRQNGGNILGSILSMVGLGHKPRKTRKPRKPKQAGGSIFSDIIRITNSGPYSTKYVPLTGQGRKPRKKKQNGGCLRSPCPDLTIPRTGPFNWIGKY